MLPIAAVIISYRRPQMVLACLGKLFALPDAPQKIYLVDNSPDDGTAAGVRAKYPSVEIINAGGNRGFAGGNNLGMQSAMDDGYRYILLLNDDAELLPGALQLLYESMEGDGSIGSAGPVVFYGDRGSIWTAGGTVDLTYGLVPDFHSCPQSRQPYPVDYITACAVLYRGEALRRAGLFDERLFMYYEDSDLGVRINRSGYRNVVVPAAKALHHVPTTLVLRMKTPSFLYYMLRNRILFVRKHNPIGYEAGALLWRSLGEMAVLLGKGNWSGALAGWQGVWDGIRGRGGRWQKSV